MTQDPKNPVPDEKLVTEELEREAKKHEFRVVLSRFTQDGAPSVIALANVLQWVKKNWKWEEDFTLSVIEDMIAHGALKSYKVDVLEVHIKK